MSKRGILTAADASSRFWPTLAANAVSCSQLNVALAVADHGLSAGQKRFLQSQGAQLLTHWQPDAIENATAQKRVGSPMRAWLKPFACQATPFEETIWIDADAVLLRPTGLFDALPWVTHYPFEKHEALYAGLLRAAAPGCNTCELLSINSGVLGFHRGAEFIGDWASTSLELLHDPQLLAQCKTRDQGALIVALARRNDRPRIADHRFNWPAGGFPWDQHDRRRPYHATVEALPEELRLHHPEAAIVHFLGSPKLKQRTPYFTARAEQTTACMATYSKRVNKCLPAVHSIAAQVDQVRLYLNDCPPPADLPANVVCLPAPAGNIGDRGKFYGIETVQGFVFTVDDDIHYPSDYAQTLLVQLREVGRAIVCVHGNTFADRPAHYADHYIGAPYFASLPRRIQVNVPGTGTAVWHTDQVRLRFSDFPVNNCCDLQLSRIAAQQSIPIYAVPRSAGWLSTVSGTDDIAIHKTRPHPHAVNFGLVPWTLARI